MRYQFIEIGTSDFDTLIQAADGSTIGLSIEPISYYLERLPNKPGVKKVNAALSNSNGSLKMYHIPVERIEDYGLPYWVRGCNSLSKPHQFTIDNIGSHLYNRLVQVDDVPTITWETLVEQYNIEGVDHIKIDTEGHEHIILKGYFDMCKTNPALYADRITFEYNENSDKSALDELVSSMDMYDSELCDFDIVLTKKKIVEKAYVLYATPSYINTVQGCVNSIKAFSNIPVMVYMLDSDLKVEGAKTINWKCNVEDVFQRDYIDRKDPKIYDILIQRPLIVKDALSRANVVAYVDADSVATDQVDNIFSFFNENSVHPYFVEGIYNYLMIDGVSEIEKPILELFGAERKQMYRQTGYFVAGQSCIGFLDEWWDMCNHPEIKANPKHYAPFHEETVANVLLWKNDYTLGLPYIYINGRADRINEIHFTGQDNLIREWVKIPASKDRLLFFHGEKRMEEMQKMLDILTNNAGHNFLWDNTYPGFKETIIREIFEDRIYEKLFSVEEGDVVFDIGASVGPFTYSILNKNPKHVFCFEPSYPEFKTLMLNVRQGPVTCINKGLTDKIGKCDFKFIFEDHNEAYSTTFKQVIEDYNLSKIDFLKTDCEGGEYDIFTEENIPWIINNIKKVVGEWHLSNPDLKGKFKTFRDTYLSMFSNYKIFSIDGVDITWSVWSEEFIQYYTEIIIYIDNRK